MSYTIAKPSPFLSRYIKQYWIMENYLPEGKEHSQRIIPSGLFELIFYLADKPETSDKQKAITDNIVLTGLSNQHHDLKVKGHLSLFAIYFHPQGLSAFLDLPMSELFNHSVPLKFLIKDKLNKLEDDLQNASTFQARIAVAEKFLMTQLQQRRFHKQERIAHIIQQINQHKGTVDINELASQAFLSRKQFERTFSDIVGTSPKQFQRIIRFQHAIHLKSQFQKMSLTRLAYSGGYFDQAHMIHDFKSFSGLTPKSFFSQGDVLSDYFEE